MSVQKKGAKWYPVIWNKEKKKHVWFDGFEKKTDALKEERRLRSEFDGGKVWIDESSSFNNLLKEWKELEWPELYTSKNAANTAYKLIENHIVPKLGDINADRITSQMIARLLHSAKKIDDSAPLSNATKHKILSTLISIFNCGQRWGFVNDNPCVGVKIQTPSKTKHQLWNSKELVEYLDYIKDSKYYVPIFILATTGMRRGEVCGLQWRDYSNKCLQLNRAMDVYGEITDMKTESSHRVVALMGATIELLEMQKANQLRIKKVIGDERTAYSIVPWEHICTDEWLNPIKPNALSKFFHKSIIRYNTSAEHNLPVIRLHDLRHTFASTALENDINIKIVSEMLGHSRTSTTQNIYQHVLTQNLQKDAVIKLENTIFKETLENTLENAK